jgi:hypothetical protein
MEREWILWAIILAMAIKIFIMSRSSGYTASTPLSIMDLAEFAEVPDDLKQAWQDNVIKKIVPAVQTKMIGAWNAAPPNQRIQHVNEIANWADQYVTNINSGTIAVV